MDILTEFFRHNTMMNERILEACRGLSPEQLEATITGTYGTIGATLVHTANAQEGYASRILGVERPERMPEDPFPGFAALTERFERGNAWLEQAAVHPDRDRVIEFADEDGTWRMDSASLYLLQAVNHGTEHRSQISTILTTVGIQPPEMDGWVYFEATKQFEAV